MSLGDVLAELRKEYVASIPQKIQYIEELWQKREIELLETEFHKLKGTGKTYGFPEISDLGETVEYLCIEAQASLEQALPLANALLLSFYQALSDNREFSLENEPRFQQLQSLLPKSRGKSTK